MVGAYRDIFNCKLATAQESLLRKEIFPTRMHLISNVFSVIHQQRFDYIEHWKVIFEIVKN